MKIYPTDFAVEKGAIIVHETGDQCKGNGYLHFCTRLTNTTTFIYIYIVIRETNAEQSVPENIKRSKKIQDTNMDDASSWALSGRISTDPFNTDRFYFFLP